MKTHYFYKYGKIMDLNQGCKFLCYGGEVVMLGYVNKDYIVPYGKGVYVHKNIIKNENKPYEIMKRKGKNESH